MTKNIEVTWHDGPPPSIGWWPASRSGDEDCLRWWDGVYWSHGLWKIDNFTPKEINRLAGKKIFMRKTGFDDIRWTHRPTSWPERSRT